MEEEEKRSKIACASGTQKWKRGSVVRGNRKRSVGKREREREVSFFVYAAVVLPVVDPVSGRSAVSFPGPFISRVIIIRILRCGGCGYLEALVSVVAVAAPETDEPFDRKKIPLQPFLRCFHPRFAFRSYGIVKMYWEDD